MIKFDWLESVALQENDFDIGDKTALIPDFIFSESITLIYSPPKQGKTWLAYSMGLEIIKKKEVEQLIYIDMDNSLSTLKERGINQSFITKSKIKYITRVKLQVEPIDFLKKIANSATLGAYEGIVFFLDTIKDFVDTDSKTQASEFMKYCVKIRDAGGTLIILHHSTKNGNNISGNSVFINTPDNVFEMKQKSKMGGVINCNLTVTHARGLVKNCKYSVDTKTLELKKYNAIADGMTEIDRALAQKALKALSSSNGLSKSKLIESMGLVRTDRTGKRIVEELTGSYWIEEKINSKLSKFYIKE